MTRPGKCCRVSCLPGVKYFKPIGIPMKDLEEIRLTVEELEALITGKALRIDGGSYTVSE